MTFTRPEWDEYYLAGAEWASTRADCTRAQVGALLVSRDHRVTPGYNGAPPGIPGCATAGNCPRGRHKKSEDAYYACSGLHEGEMPGDCCALWEFCICGKQWPCPDAVSPDSDYSNCIARHAEDNAITRARPEDLPGATLYVTREPCPACWTLIRSAGISRVVTPDGEV
ncbi:deoxycytidylate deaminase [Streptomyces ardesiacus]|uniref:deoxycytidylate deaminase n=1 Tax=Streptomyces ardesiacus TaxID=285564 RepID=UPI00365519DC